MIGRLSDMSPGLLAMYGLLAWAGLSLVTAAYWSLVATCAKRAARGTQSAWELAR